MKRYDKYKDSDIEWIGEIPEHWDCEKLGKIGYFSSSGIDKKTVEGQPLVKMINYTDVYGNERKTLTNNREYMVVSCPVEKKQNHQVSIGDLIFTPSSETVEDIGLSALVINELGNTVFSYHVVRLQLNNKFDIDFRKYLCNNNFVLNQFSKEAKGTTRQIIGRSVFKNIKVVIPPKPEQTTIANFLDRKTAEIDNLISKKEKLLELYDEEKTALINQAVTKGINPNVKMKDSGIDWLGEIPEHWEVKRVATLGSFSKGKGIPRSDLKDDGYPAILYGDIYTKYNIKAEEIINHIDEETTNSSVKIEKGDLLFTGSGETKEDIGKCITYLGNQIVYAGGDVIILKQKKCDSLFLSYLLNSNISIFQKARMAKGQIIIHIYSSNLREIILPIPPKEEQTAIVHHIETETTRINSKISKTEKLIELLKEYKTALISEVVTGKVKVT
ncbi:MAG: restriction endonuclease subunit S [Candidatus Marinimicrobia bacterium]|jgi:type I restriction enzyme S subunit|nr:restriction endonuclease subunit S [Candidatus Neomarinimicrobiota bacterium]